MFLFRFFFVHALISILLSDSKCKRYDSVDAFLVRNDFHSRKVIPDIRIPNTISNHRVRSRSWTMASRWRKVGSQGEHQVASITRHATEKDTDQEPNSRLELGRRFVEEVEESLEKDGFVSLVLRGVKKKKAKKKSSNKTIPAKDNDEEDLLRGSIRQVQGRLVRVSSSKKKKNNRQKTNNDEINADDTMLLLQMTLKYHGATDICKNFQLEEVPETIYNLILGDPAEMASEWGVQAVRAQPIQGAQLITTDKTWDLRLDGTPSLREQKVKNTDGTAASAPTSVVSESHDRVKQVPLSNQADFFKTLGVTKEDGQPKPKMKAKLRQCQKFVEIVGRIVDECQKGQNNKISVVDMGCGRAYLTFSLHAYLQERYGSVTTTGIDVRPKLVAEISGIARSLGTGFDSLNFEEGTIEKVVAQASTTLKQETDDDVSLNVLVALHACDTATDDALYSGIAQNADIIVVAPCCHKQVRPQLNAHFSSTRQTHALSAILKHGVYRERMSETVTDSLRALILEFAGYKVQVFEFIGGEHTSKNVMITAIKSHHQPANDNDRKSDAESIRQQIVSLAGLHGVSHQKLAQLMEFDLLEGDEPSIQHNLSRKASTSQLSKHRMPPARL